MKRQIPLSCCQAALALAIAAPLAAAAPAPRTKTISPPARASGLPTISDNGRYAAYVSNIVRQGGRQQRNQIFLWDDRTRRSRLISQDYDRDADKQSAGNSLYPAISGDGSRVVYAADARDLDPDCADGQMHIYLRLWDQLKSSDCLSAPPRGVTGDGMNLYPAISGNGLTVSWASNVSTLVPSDTNDRADIFVWTNGQDLRLASVASDGAPANGHSSLSSLDQTGQRLAFMSEASNLVSGDTNEQSDIFIRDLAQAKTALVSIGVNGEAANGLSAGPALSRDGRHVAFVSAASNLVPGDTNGQRDIFVRHLDSQTTERVSLASDGTEANGHSDFASITANGRCVAFQSDATNLAPGDSNADLDVFVRDRQTGRTERVSLGRRNLEPNDDSFFPVISADGTTVAFTSTATRLAPGSDRDDDPDVFVRKLPAGLCH